MAHFAANILVFLAILAASVAHAEQTDRPQLASYRVVIPEGNSLACGSATAIGDRVLLTNSHVVGHRFARGEVVYGPTSQRWPIHCLGYSPERDVAILWVIDRQAEPLKWVPVAETDPQAGQQVTFFGYGQRGVLATSSGKISGANRLGPETISLVSTHQIESGDSGSGVFNEQAELIAINWGSDGQTAACVPASEAREFLGIWLAQCQSPGCVPWWRTPSQPSRPATPPPGRHPVPPDQINGPTAQQPRSPAAAPVTPQPSSPVGGCACDLSGLIARVEALTAEIQRSNVQIESRIARIEAQVIAIEQRPCPPGPQGPSGPPGPPGPQGLAGTTAIDYQRLDSLIEERLRKQLRVEVERVK